MARYRRMNMAIRPVHRLKHVVDSSGTIATAGTQVDVALVQAIDAPVLANTNQVETGAKVNGIYVKFEVTCLTNVAGAIPNVFLSFMKNPGNNIVIPVPNAVGANDNKRFVIHQEMFNIQNQTEGNPRVGFNGVIVIPKGMRRFGPDDRLYVSVISPQCKIAYCVQAHYKEFR